MFRKQDFKKIDLLGSGNLFLGFHLSIRQEKHQDLQGGAYTNGEDLRDQGGRGQDS